jgi:hypothetical protein
MRMGVKIWWGLWMSSCEAGFGIDSQSGVQN